MNENIAKAAPFSPIPFAVSCESINLNDEATVPVYRINAPDLFVALNPPKGEPYVVAPYDMPPDLIVKFFIERITILQELQEDMRKRFEKSSSRKCRFKTGDVAYVMGRPFQLKVYPLASKAFKMKAGARVTSTSKYSVSADVSLLTLYAMKPNNYDDVRKVFEGYAAGVIVRNAKSVLAGLAPTLGLNVDGIPEIRMRTMRNAWGTADKTAIWLSSSLIPYPPECLVYVLWNELVKISGLSETEGDQLRDRVLPNWREAKQILSSRPEPYSLQ